MKARWSAVVLGALIASVAGLAGADDGPESRTTFAGTVVDAGGKPVAGAEVVACTFSYFGRPKGMLLSSVRTRADGKFVVSVPVSAPFGDYPRERCIVAARKAGLAIGWVQRDLQGSWGDEPRKIVLGKAAALSGVVVDAGGRPIGGAKVAWTLYGPETKTRYSDSLRARPPLPWGQTTTHPRGRFRLDDIPSDAKAALHVTMPTGQVRVVPEGWNAPREALFTPGGDPIRITMPPPATISATVVDKKTGRPVDKITLSIHEDYGAHANLFPTRTVKVKGSKFTVGHLPPGRYRISHDAPVGTAPHWIVTSGPITVRAGQNLTNARIELSPGGILEVVVTDGRTRAPVPDTVVSVASSDAAPDALSTSAMGITDANGVARFRVLPGLHHLTFVSGGRTYVHKMAFRPEKALQRTVEEGKTVRLAVALKRKLRVTGVVRDKAGKPVGGAKVSIAGRYGTGDSTRTNNDGRFVIWVDKGKYGTVAKLILVQHAQRKLAAFTAIPKSLKAEITLLPTASISGRVVGRDGKPFAKAKVMVWIGADPYMTSIYPDLTNVTTDATGRYTFDRVPVGPKCKVAVSAPGYANQQYVWWAMEPFALKVSDFVMVPADQVISGVVVDETGKPVAGAVVDASGEGMDFRIKAATTDAAGKFEIKDLPKSRILLYARHADLGNFASVQAGDRNVKIALEKDEFD